MKKRLLVTGGGYADIPVIKAAKKLGFFVVTSGLDENGLGNAYSDSYCPADNSDKEAILDVARRSKVDALCPSAAGYSSVTCSYAAEQLGIGYLDPYPVAETLHYKDRFQKVAKENSISIPRAESFEDIQSACDEITRFAFPLIIKPADLSGGKGILKVTSRQEALAAVANAFDRSKIKKVVVEEFIEGSNHGFSSILREGKVAFYFYDSEYYFLNKYTVAGASAPADVPSQAINIIIKDVEKLASVLKLKNGIFHLQFILKGQKPYIIDICRRVPGDLYVDFVKYATGIDYGSYIVKACTGLNIDDLEQKDANGYITRHVVMSGQNGTFKDIIIDKELQGNIVAKIEILKKGDKITDFLTQRLGVYILRYGSKEECHEKNQRIFDLIKAEVED